MKLDFRKIGARIAKQRREKGLKQYEVCEIINVNYKYLSNLETGRSAPSLETLLALCECLDTTPDWLLLGRKNNPDTESDNAIEEKITALDDENKRMVLEFIDLLIKYQ